MIGKKVLFGLLGAGAATAAAGYMMLPKDSKIKKAIDDKAGAIGGMLKKQMTRTAEARTAPVRK